jgi:lysophospholipase L1-like esterase
VIPRRLLWSVVVGCFAAGAISCATTKETKREGIYAEPLRFVGRVDQREQAGPRFAWSGTGIVFRFKGTGARVELRELEKTPYEGDAIYPNRFRVELDSVHDLDVFPDFNGRIIWEGTDLEDGEHTVRILKESEALVGTAQLIEVSVAEGGELLPPPPAPERRIEFIGDSLTTGYGNEGTDAACPFSSNTQAFTKAFPWLTAQWLDADVDVVAWAGRGVARNWDGGTEGLIPTLYPRALPDDGGSEWAAGDQPPSAVVIHAGSNDFAPGVPEDAAFMSAYSALVERVLQRYPDAKVFCVFGGTLSDSHPKGQEALTNMRGFVSAVVETLAETYPGRVHLVELSQRKTEDGRGCVGHPTVATHERMAEELAEAMLSVLDG